MLNLLVMVAVGWGVLQMLPKATQAWILFVLFAVMLASLNLIVLAASLAFVLPWWSESKVVTLISGGILLVIVYAVATWACQAIKGAWQLLWGSAARRRRDRAREQARQRHASRRYQ